MVLRRALRPTGLQSVRDFIHWVLSLAQGTLENSRSIIRSLTFDALGLTHTCCHITDPANGPPVVIEDREKEEAQEIRDEEKHILKRFETLLNELYSKFDESNIPIVDFLQQVWYPQVMDFLSHQDRYDEEHFEEAARLGVHLELEKPTVPNRVSLMIGSRIQEYEDVEDSKFEFEEDFLSTEDTET
ncbi:hypothetical protein BJX99DRAFT_265471 [Aspergillus californicus]